MIEKILANKYFHAVLLLFFYIIMIVEYINFVYLYFSSNGFVLEYNFTTISVGLLLLLLVFFQLFFIKYASNLTYVINIFISLFFCIPAIIMYQFGNITVFIPIYTFLFLFLLSCSYIKIPRPSKHLNIKHLDIILIFFTLLMLIPFIFIYRFNVNLKVFSFGSELYEVRANAKANGNIITAYLFGPITKVMLPILIVYGLLTKKKIIYLISIAMMLYLFMVNPHKALFLSIFLVILFYFFNNYQSKAGLMITGVILLILSSILISVYTGNILFESIFVRRMFFLPVQICDNYFSFYENNQIYLSHSVLKNFIEYPYNLEPSLLMGEMMYNRPATSCNTGIIADGYMNFGHIGCILYILIATFFIKFLESLNIHHSFFGIILLFIFLFLNSALLTSLLTHGGLLLCIIAVLFLKDTQMQKV